MVFWSFWAGLTHISNCVLCRGPLARPMCWHGPQLGLCLCGSCLDVLVPCRARPAHMYNYTTHQEPEATRPRRPLHPRVADAATPITHHRCPLSSLLPPVPGLARRGAMSRSLSMRGSMRARRDLPPPEKVRDPLSPSIPSSLGLLLGPRG
jgi:hypothetical protein